MRMRVGGKVVQDQQSKVKVISKYQSTYGRPSVVPCGGGIRCGVEADMLTVEVWSLRSPATLIYAEFYVFKPGS